MDGAVGAEVLPGIRDAGLVSFEVGFAQDERITSTTHRWR
jgi:hypothetical protein